LMHATPGNVDLSRTRGRDGLDGRAGRGESRTVDNCG
jgi:hypothetical protein